MSGIYTTPDGQQVHGDGKPVGKPPSESSFVPAPGSAATLAGITMKDLRDAAIKIPHMDKVDFVRVSNGWWVKLENGKPCAIIPHGPLMQIIHENFSPPNDKLCREAGQKDER